MSSKPRRKHKLHQKLRHGPGHTGTTPPHSPFASSPFASPLRFTPKKSLLRISSPKATKSPLTERMLPESLPLDAISKELEDHADEEYPEVPRSPNPQHMPAKVPVPAPAPGQAKEDDNADNNNMEDDDISSVSSGSKNGEVIIRDMESEDGEEWDFKQFTPEPKRTSTTSSAKKKVGKLLGKGTRRFFKGKKNKKRKNKNGAVATSETSSEMMLGLQQTSSEMMLGLQQPQQSHEMSKEQSLQEQSKEEQSKEGQSNTSTQAQAPQQEGQLQQQSPPTEPQQQSIPEQQAEQQQVQQPPAPQQPAHTPKPPQSKQQQKLQQKQHAQAPQKLLSPIRIKRQRKVQPQSQSPDGLVESPCKAPRNQHLDFLKKGGRSRVDAATPLRSDALWTQTIMVDSDQETDKEDPLFSPKAGEEQEQQPKQENDTVRSDALWAQTMMMGDNNAHNDGVDSYGILTPEVMSPKTPTTATEKSFAAATTVPMAKIPDLSETDDSDDKDNNTKMDTIGNEHTSLPANHANNDGTAAEITTAAEAAAAAVVLPTTTTLADIEDIEIENDLLLPPGEDGNIVDEDDLLDLIPSDEQEDEDEDDEEDHREEENETVGERDRNNSIDSAYYFHQILSDDEDEEGGVVSEHDEELILEEQKSLSKHSTPFDEGDVMLSDVLSRDSNSIGLGPGTDDDESKDSEKAFSASQSSEVEVEMGNADNVDNLDNVPKQQQEQQPPASAEAFEVAENDMNTTFDSNYTLNDSDLAELEKEKAKEKPPPLSISERSSKTNMQHRLLSMRTIKDSYKRKLVLQEQETVQLQVELLASQYEAREAKMSILSAETALMNERAKLRASENDCKEQKVLLQIKQEQLSIVQTQLKKLQAQGQDGTSDDHSDEAMNTTYDMKLASMEEQLLVQDEEMDQLAKQIQDLKGKTAELEVGKAEAEQKWKEALEREESLKAQLSERGQQIPDSEPKMNEGEKGENDSNRQEIQQLEELMKANKERYEAESAGLRKRLEFIQMKHELEVANLQEQEENNKQLADASQEEAEIARTELLQELADTKLEHTRMMEELRESLAKSHQEEKTMLQSQYTNDLERLEGEEGNAIHI